MKPISRIIAALSSCPTPSTAPRALRLFRCLAIATAILCVAAPCLAQQPPEGSSWRRVQALPLGVSLDIKSTHQHVHCSLTAVTDDSLTCTRAASAPVVFQRPEITSIRIGHRVRSTLIGGGVGGGVLGLTFFAATTSSGGGFFGPNFLRGPATAVGLVAGGVLGGGIGALTDFSKSTVYQAPKP